MYNSEITLNFELSHSLYQERVGRARALYFRACFRLHSEYYHSIERGRKQEPRKLQKPEEKLKVYPPADCEDLDALPPVMQ